MRDLQNPMSIQIQSNVSAGISGSPTSRVDPSGSQGALGKRGISSGVDGGDQVQVSSIVESIAAATSILNQERAARVAQLSRLHSSGDYGVSSAQVSAALITRASLGTWAGSK